MVKKIFILLLLLAVAAYLLAAVTALNRPAGQQACNDVKLVIKDSVYAGFITRQEVLGMLGAKRLAPLGKPLAAVRTKQLEEVLSQHPLIDRVECYKTPSGKVCVEVSQRIPVLRVMTDRGDNYYVDNKGTVMPPGAKCVAHVVLATGSVEKAFAVKDLYNFAVFLQGNAFWDAQIEQVCVLPDHTVELVPRVGDHLVYLGTLDGFPRKLERLEAFYKKALNKIGWNKYSRISVEFDNQIICTKK